MKTFSNLLRSSESAGAEMSCSENCLRVSAMLAWSTVMVFRTVSAHQVVKCRKRIALSESLKDEGDLPTHLPVGVWHAFHDFGGHDGLRVRQEREGLRIVYAGTNEELDMIAESMDLLWGPD